MSNVFHILTGLPLDPESGTTPRPGECLPCFVRRMTLAGACTGTFWWTESYRDQRSRRATSLVKRLRGQGADCDCGVTSIAWIVNPALWVTTRDGSLVEPTELPRCAGVRPGSTQGCDHWAAPHDIAL